VCPPPIIVLVALGWLATSACADWFGPWRPPVLTSAQAVRNYSVEQTQERRPVRLSGVVTHVGSPTAGFYLQDKTAGILVRSDDLALGINVGDRVEVEGTTGLSAPLVEARAVRRIGVDPLPEPQPYNLAPRELRWFDGRLVNVWAIVQNAWSEAGSTYIDVYTAHGQAVLVIPGKQWAIRARKMREEAIAARGVCVAPIRDRRIVDVPTILLADFPEAASTLISSRAEPVRPIGRMLETSPRFYPGTQRVMIQGIVTAAPLPNLLMVQDATGGAAVWSDNPTGQPVGARVSAFGLPLDGSPRALHHALVARLGDGELPGPAVMSAAEFASGLRGGIRVCLTGRADGLRTVEGWTAISLSEDDVRFEAFVPGTPEQNGLAGKIEIGSRLALVGVPAAVTPHGGRLIAPGVFLLNEEAIQVIQPAPTLEEPAAPSSWLTPARAAYMFGGVSAVLLLGGGWMVALRKQARRAAVEAQRQSEEKVRLERQLRQASKLEAVGRLAGGIAHDFNNLLTVINGCAELLAEETARDGNAEGRLNGLTDDIRKAGERAASLTGQLLTFSRKRDIVIGPVKLNDVVNDTIQLLRRVIGEEIRIESALAADLPHIRGEAGLLHQVMMNLAVNAKDAMPEGGVLAFTTALVVDASNPDSRTRQFVRLTVADTGTGMTDEVKSRLFEPFFTTKAVGSGTGLGLFTVSSIAQMLNARVNVDSAVGTGTRFHIDLRIHGQPLSDAEFALQSDSTPYPLLRGPNLPRLAGATVLVVEDNELVRATIAAGLCAEGATVLCAECPRDALAVLSAHAGAVDVLVTDVVMPGMSGPVLAERARETRPEMRVVFMSGYSAEEVNRQGVQEGEVEFLQKPFTPDSLIRRLVRVLPHRSEDRGQRSGKKSDL
jgi:two-component system cell cycle sensor histidine kinase/response regulator CckA